MGKRWTKREGGTEELVKKGHEKRMMEGLAKRRRE